MLTSSRAPRVSFVVPCYNEGEVLQIFAQRLTALMREVQRRFGMECEVIFVDDGSTDPTWSQIEQLMQYDPRFRGAQLEVNQGQQRAILRGYKIAKGDAIITLDADLQDPPELCLEMLAKYSEGAHLVIARRRDRSRDDWLKRFTAFAFYRVMACLGLSRQAMDCGEFRLMSRCCMQRLMSASGQILFHRLTVTKLGFQPQFVEFERPERAAGVTKYSYRRMAKLAWDAFRLSLNDHRIPKLTSGTP